MHEFTPLTGALGGALIGLAAALLLALNGRIAGISGIVGGLLPPRAGDALWRLLFVLGLALGALLVRLYSGAPLAVPVESSTFTLVLGGLLVGFGTRLGSGCTSGHGICGLARLSPRSLVAVLTFMASAMLTVFALRHALGGGS
jgi:uncharacterized membrane protein YedE/YeeE